MSLISRQYMTYHLRWQLATLVMMGPMTVLDYVNLPVQLNLAVTQFIGACIFWYIDKWIFSEDADLHEAVQDAKTFVSGLKPV
ncbi:MAG: hypothetical protein ABEJ95_05995 [Candidatus Nanohalobium sp.]